MSPLALAQQIETELHARRRVLPDVGPGVREIKRDAAGRYYVLTAPAPAVFVYDSAGNRLAQIPAASSKGASLVYGEDFDLDAEGRVYVADRGADAVKIFAADGRLVVTVAIAAPTSVVLIGNGEFAVASGRSARLVTVYDTRGKVVREFGDATAIAERGELNRFLNIGRLAGDAAGHLYYAFSYLPEPTIRKYDRYGYNVGEIALTALEFYPQAQATRREIARQERGGTPSFKPTVNAVAVDPVTEDVWVALGGLLVRFDRDGNRRATYRTYAPDGVRLEITALLLEPERLLLATDAFGLYEFARPDKAQP